MRIIYLSDFLTIHDERFLCKLAEKGYDTWLVTYYHQPRLPERIRRIKGLHIVHWYNQVYAKRFEVDREYVSLESSDWLARLLGLQGLGQCFRHFCRAIEQIEPDVVHAGWVYSSGLIAAMSGFQPWLLMPWGSDIQVFPYESRLRRLVARYVLRRADMITCDCQAVKEHIIQLAGYPADRIVVVPWGVDLQRFRPLAQPGSVRTQLGWENAKIIIITRQLRSFYGIEYLVSAMPAILAAEPQARLLICGDGPLESVLRDMVRQLDLETAVHFAGFVPNPLLPECLNAADVYVSPSLEDGSSLSLMEAMTCGLPVVVTDIPAALEWVKDGQSGYVVPKRDVERLATAITNVLHDDTLRSQMSKHSLATAHSRADWDKNFALIEEIYHRLIPTD